MSGARTARACIGTAVTLAAFQAWLASLDALPATLRMQGVVLSSLFAGAWLGIHLRAAPFRAALLGGAFVCVVPLLVERAAFGDWAGDLPGLSFVVLAGECAALGASRALRAWGRLRERSLIWSLTHAHLVVVATLAGLALLVHAIFQLDSGYMRSLTAGLPGDAQLAVRIVAGVLPIVVVVGGLAALALPMVMPPALLLSWLAARGMARRVEQLVAIEAMANARRDLFGRVSHELKNPLTALRAAVDGLRARGPRLPEVEVLDDGVARLTHLVGDLGELARAEIHGLQLRIEDVDVAHSVDVVARAHAHLAAQYDVALVSHADPGAPPTHRLDRLRFEQVLANLLQNALRHVDPGGLVRLQVSTRSGRTLVSVEDTGGGIDRETLAHVFEPGFSRDGGLGLGLALARELTERMGGTIDVDSSPGRGTRFTIVLGGA